MNAHQTEDQKHTQLIEIRKTFQITKILLNEEIELVKQYQSGKMKIKIQ